MAYSKEITPPIDRLRSFLLIEDGWMNGDGEKPNHTIVNFLIDNYEKIFGGIVLTPYVYPTPTGGIQLEWETGEEVLEMYIKSIEEAEYFVMTKVDGTLNLDESADGRIDLSNSGGWDILRIIVNTMN